MALEPISDAINLAGDIPTDEVPIRLVKEDQLSVEILLPQVTPRAVATLIQVSGVNCQTDTKPCSKTIQCDLHYMLCIAMK